MRDEHGNFPISVMVSVVVQMKDLTGHLVIELTSK
jgi:hypothetical protein